MTPDLTLRVAVAQDVAWITDLWYRGWRLGHADIVPEGLLRFRNPAQFRDRVLASLNDCYVTDDQQGFIRLKGDELDQFYIDPSQQGRGYAARLMQAAEHVMAARGIRHAHLIASLGNDRAIRFYARRGWQNMGVRIVGVETDSGPFEMDVVRFEKTLTP